MWTPERWHHLYSRLMEIGTPKNDDDAEALQARPAESIGLIVVGRQEA
jgi:hypothetical protein